MNGYAATDLYSFLDYVGDKGLTNKAMANARRVGCTKILEVVSPQGVDDIRELDLDDVMVRFENLVGSKYSPGTKREYRSRLGKSIEDFLRYKSNPSNFKMGTGSTRPSQPKETKTRSTEQISKAEADLKRVDAVQTDAHTHPALPTIDFPIPLRPGCIVYVNGLPVDLTKAEATKISNVVVAMISELSE